MHRYLDPIFDTMTIINIYCRRNMILMNRESLTSTSHQTGTKPRLQIFILETLVDVHTATEQGLHCLHFVEEDEGPQADPN